MGVVAHCVSVRTAVRGVASTTADVAAAHLNSLTAGSDGYLRDGERGRCVGDEEPPPG